MALGLAVRLAFVLIKQSQVVLRTSDNYWYHMQAKLVADGRGFLDPFLLRNTGIEAPGAQHPPGFVLILTVLDLLGIDTPQGQRIVMTFVGTASILVIALLGRRIASPRVGIVAAFIAALYPNLWINDGMLLVETVYILAIAVTLLLTYRYLAQPRWGDLVGLSAALTAAAMTRPESLVLFGVVVTPLVLTRTSLRWSQRLTQLAVAALVPIAAFAPWVTYNLTGSTARSPSAPAPVRRSPRATAIRPSRARSSAGTTCSACSTAGTANPMPTRPSATLRCGPTPWSTCRSTAARCPV